MERRSLADDYPMAPDSVGHVELPGIAPQALVRREDFTLGGALIRPSMLTVEGPVGTHRIEPRVMQVLMAFVDAGDKVLSRDDLIRECWDGRIVGDDSIHRVIGELRKLARETGAGFAIETIQRVGYKLTSVAQGDPAGERNRIASPTSRRWVLGGVAAGASAVALGTWSFVRSRPDPRFTALMARGRQLLNSDMAGSNVQAAGLFSQAVKVESGSANAWGLLALSTTGLGYETAPPFTEQVVRTAEEAARRALALDTKEPNALLAMALLQSRLDDWVTTEDKFRRIIEIAPDHVPAIENLVFLLQGVGRSRESWDLNERAMGIDPLSSTVQLRRALKHWIFGRVGEADRVIDRAMELWPRHPWVWNARLLIYAFTGRPSAALALLEDVSNRPATLPKLAIEVWQASLVALDSRQGNDIAAARELIFQAAPQAPGIAAYGVMQLSALGEVDAAYAVADGFLLHRGKLVTRGLSPTEETLSKSRSWYRTQWVFIPATAPLRADPRFAELCEGIGLTAYWRQRGTWPDPFQRGSLAAKA